MHLTHTPQNVVHSPYHVPYAIVLADVCSALANLKAQDVVCIDVTKKSSVADHFVVATGTSTRHVKAIAEEVQRSAKQKGVCPLGVEGERDGEWVLVDLGDIIVHVMLAEVRALYALERLWMVPESAFFAADTPRS